MIEENMDHSRPFISLCMIVRDEEPYLRRCLESFQGSYDELIVVDTGSRDGTVEIARQFDARVEQFEWRDDFGAARNYACGLAGGAWIVMPDGDEYLGPEGIGPRVPDMLRQVPERVDKLLIECRTLLGEGILTGLVDRVFRNRPDLRWKYRIHEVIETPRERTVMTHDFYLLHDNALKRRQDMRVSREREEMYLRALVLDVEDYPDDPRPLFYLAGTLYGAGRYGEALEAYARYFDLSEGAEPTRRAAAFRDAAAAAGALGRHVSRRTLLFRSLAEDWRPAETYVALADMALDHNNRDEAVHWLTVATGCRPVGDTFCLSTAYGTGVWKRLAGLYREAGDQALAVRCEARARKVCRDTKSGGATLDNKGPRKSRKKGRR
jgi:glycosyltransferase involved in cell wall biosynthesis